MWHFVCFCIKIISKHQIQNGMKRVRDISGDLSLDTPNAHGIIQEFIDRLHSEGVLDSLDGLTP